MPVRLGPSKHRYLILQFFPIHLLECPDVQEVGDSLDLMGLQMSDKGKEVNTLDSERLAFRRFTMQKELQETC